MKDSEDSMDARNFTYMFYGFLAVWMILMIYLLLLVSRERNIRRQLDSLKNMLEQQNK